MRPVAAILTILLLLATASPTAAAPLTDTRLEGHVLDLDGRPAAGYRVHLIDDDGHAASGAAVDAEGAYRIGDIEAGNYAMAVQTPDGRFAAVEGAEVRMRTGHLVRRDLKLAQRDPSLPPAEIDASGGFGTWWAGLDGAAKAWSIAAVVLVVGITADALSDDETASSVITP